MWSSHPGWGSSLAVRVAGFNRRSFYFFSIAFLFCILFASFLQYEWHIIKRVFSNQKAHRLFWQKCSPLKSLKKEKHISFTTYCFLLLSDPQDQDIEELVKYLGQLVLDSDLEMVDLILKFLHRWVFSKTCSKRFGVLFLIFFYAAYRWLEEATSAYGLLC